MDVNRLISVLFGWLPFGKKRQLPRLMMHTGVQRILSSTENVEEVFSSDNILSKGCILHPGHLMRSLVRAGLLCDVVSLFDKDANVHFLVARTGAKVCGHPTIVHGGLQGTLCDEVFAGLIYGMKRHSALAEGPAVTANLSLNFRKPMPAQNAVLCTAKIQKIEGRKVFVEASIDDLDSEDHYADATALFILLQPKKQAGGPA